MRPPRALRGRHGRLQLSLAAAAMAVAVSLPVILLSVGGGVSAHELSSLRSTGFEITLSAPGDHGISGAHGLARNLSSLPSVAAASPVLSVAVEMARSGGGWIPLLVEGVIPAAFTATLPGEETGLFPAPLGLGDPQDAAHYANGTYAGPSAGRILLSSPIAAAYGVGPGTPILLSPTENASEGRSFLVAGIFGVPPALLGPTAAFAALLPLSDLQLLTGNARGPAGEVLDRADTVEIALAGSAATDPGAVGLTADLLQARYPYYSVSTQAQAVAEQAQAAGILTGFYLALSAVGLSVGLLFLALVLVRRVERERPTIAVRRAIGERGSAIVLELAGQAVVLAAIGAAGGLLLGWALVTALATWGTGSVQTAAGLATFDPVTLSGLVLGVLALAALSSLLAARSALRGSITEALR